jgi:hypothetical protein
VRRSIVPSALTTVSKPALARPLQTFHCRGSLTTGTLPILTRSRPPLPGHGLLVKRRIADRQKLATLLMERSGGGPVVIVSANAFRSRYFFAKRALVTGSALLQPSDRHASGAQAHCSRSGTV